MLNLYRRHLQNCKHRAKGREHTKCNCPLWADGDLNGKRYLKSLKTRDYQRALRLAERLERPASERSDLIPCAQQGCTERVERGRCAKHSRTISQAVQSFHDATNDLGAGTRRNYKRTLRFFGEMAGKRSLHGVDEITVEHIDAFRASRSINALTWTKELAILRHFFRFCADREWTPKNPASQVAMPRNIQPSDKEPYSRNDIIKILAACDAMGRNSYERLRARAMTLLLRYTALRISDVALLAKDRIRNGEIYLRTTKNGKPVKLPVHSELQGALEVLPEPRAGIGECRYFFWSGNGTSRAMIRDATRAMAAVFKASGVKGAHAHRFRHTLATEILEAGGSIEDAADILGNSPNIIRKHYAKWTALRQERISTLMKTVFSGAPRDTSEIHRKTGSANA